MSAESVSCACAKLPKEDDLDISRISKIESFPVSMRFVSRKCYQLFNMLRFVVYTKFEVSNGWTLVGSTRISWSQHQTKHLNQVDVLLVVAILVAAYLTTFYLRLQSRQSVRRFLLNYNSLSLLATFVAIRWLLPHRTKSTGLLPSSLICVNNSAWIVQVFCFWEALYHLCYAMVFQRNSRPSH